MKYRIGITGSRHEPRAPQAGRLGVELCRLARPGIELSHGDCQGADALAHDLCMLLDFRIFVHPPLIDTWRAHKQGHHVHEAKDYVTRDADIVYASQRLIAMPRHPEKAEESRRSGTWLTVRLARQKPIPIMIIKPNGSVEYEGAW